MQYIFIIQKALVLAGCFQCQFFLTKGSLTVGHMNHRGEVLECSKGRIVSASDKKGYKFAKE